MSAPAEYELITVLDAPYELHALLYRRLPAPDALPWPPVEPDPWQAATFDEADPWAEVADNMTIDRDAVAEALAHLTPEQRSAMGLPAMGR